MEFNGKKIDLTKVKWDNCRTLTKEEKERANAVFTSFESVGEKRRKDKKRKTSNSMV